jgi:2-hydroxy-3-keto-5-methylthiopentenyl-1-phosphate phosphatase
LNEIALNARRNPMPDAMPTTDSGSFLVSDFDGTMTRHDFYRLAIEKLLPAETPDHWADYRAGTITHFEALRRYFAAIRKTEDEVLAVVRQMELDPGLRGAVEELHQAGWSVIVTSAGCEWYIRRLLTDARANVTVHANPGRFEASRGLIMEMPVGSPYLSPSLGVDKTAVVKKCVAKGGKVAFAGDGFPDVEAARLVPGQFRFARGDLADVLQKEGLEFQRFRSWSEIAGALLRERK